jgi:hypothetical protein
MINTSTGIRIFSFSLYGNSCKYTYNCVANVLIAKQLFPDWEVRVYYDSSVPADIITYLKVADNVNAIDMTNHWLTPLDKMLWRNLAVDDENAEVVCIRDCDSWLSNREKNIVNEWLDSDKDLHIIRDHCYHSKHIMGGMWGVRNKLFADMEMNLKKYLSDHPNHRTHTGEDQDFLRDYYYHKYKETTMVHMSHQYNNQHRDIWLTGGYFPDETDVHIVPATLNRENDEIVPGLSFIDANILNTFACQHCGRADHVYIGAMFNKMTPKAYTTTNNAICAANAVGPQISDY